MGFSIFVCFVGSTNQSTDTLQSSREKMDQQRDRIIPPITAPCASAPTNRRGSTNRDVTTVRKVSCAHTSPYFIRFANRDFSGFQTGFVIFVVIISNINSVSVDFSAESAQKVTQSIRNYDLQFHPNCQLYFETVLRTLFQLLFPFFAIDCCTTSCMCYI